MKTRIIPIGIDCSPTHFLRANVLRHEAYPFDWTVTPLRSAIELIENDFEGFLEYENLEFLSPTNRLLFEENGVDLKISEDIITPVICRRYGILFPHDFSKLGEDDYTKVKLKYKRRIERFKGHVLDAKSVRFVFHIGSLNDWQIAQYRTVGLNFDHINQHQFLGIRASLEEHGYKFIALPELKAENTGFRKRVWSLTKRAWSLTKRVLKKISEQGVGGND